MAYADKVAYIYVMGHNIGPQKVGWAQDPSFRLRYIRRDANDPTLPLFKMFEVRLMWALHAERMAHWILRADHLSREWFNCSPDVAAAAAEEAVKYDYAGALEIPAICRPPIYAEQIALRLKRGTFARIEAVTGNRDRSDFIRDAVDEKVARLEAELRKREKTTR